MAAGIRPIPRTMVTSGVGARTTDLPPPSERRRIFTGNPTEARLISPSLDEPIEPINHEKNRSPSSFIDGFPRHISLRVCSSPRPG